jgi:thioredoxin reductase
MAVDTADMDEIDSSWDVIVVGGGSAGLSAALMLVRARRRVLVLDNGQPRNRVAPRMHGLLGRDHTSPLDLLADGRREIKGYGGRCETGTVLDVEAIDDGFVVATEDGRRRTARRLLVATGLRDDLPAIPGLHEQWGRGVVVCPYCDGYEVRDRRIAVVATAPMSVFQAKLLRQWSADVTFFSRAEFTPTEHDRAEFDARNITVNERPIARIVSSDGVVTAVETVDCDRIGTDVVFIAPPSIPRDDILRRLGASRTDDGWTRVDSAGKTTVAGLYAVGNVVDLTLNVAMSIGAGAAVGGAINADLLVEDTSIALAQVPTAAGQA